MPREYGILKFDPCRQCLPSKCLPTYRRRWSLTVELGPGGCAHHYMMSALPELANYVRSLNLPKGNLLVEAPKGWESFMGTAFDRRLRYEYNPDYTDEVIECGAHTLAYPFEQVAPSVYEGWLSPTEYAEIGEGLMDEDLDKRSVYAAVADIEFRSRRGKETWDAIASGGDELRGRLIADLEELMRIARENLHLSSPKFGPTFGIGSDWIGGADADVVDEGFLIDIKCGKQTSRERTKFIRQTIAYALLDTSNEHKLDSVGVYFARQGILWKIPLAGLAKYAGTTISKLRSQAPWSNS